MSDVFHGIADEEVLEKTSDSVKIKFVIPVSSDYFDGHFPSFKLLPAVAQFDLAAYFARKYLDAEFYVAKISRMKFLARLLPDTLVSMSLSYDEKKESVAFSISEINADNTEIRVFSSGTFTVGRNISHNNIHTIKGSAL